MSTSVYKLLSTLFCLYCRFLSELGRHNYVTPTSYLELIETFRQLLTQRRDAIMKAKRRYTNGLEKLAFTESQVCVAPLWWYLTDFRSQTVQCVFVCAILFVNIVSLQVEDMKKELEDLQPKLKKATIENDKIAKVKFFFPSSSCIIIHLECMDVRVDVRMLIADQCDDFQEVEEETKEVLVKRKVVRDDEEAASIKAEEAGRLMGECQKEVAKAEKVATDVLKKALGKLKVGFAGLLFSSLLIQ